MPRATEDPRDDRQSHAVAVLVVIADPQIHELVGWIVEEMDLSVTLTASWRNAVAATIGRPGCIVSDLDDVGDRAAGVNVLRKSWGGSVPLVVPSGRPDVEDRAMRIGAVAGIHIPINV